MSIFLSKTNIIPFILISSSNPILYETDIYPTTSYDHTEIEDNIYLIAEDENYPQLIVKVENETQLGTSLWISKTNINGDIIGWQKTLTFENINAANESDNRIILHIKTKWSFIHNPVLLKTFQANANINIYDLN